MSVLEVSSIGYVMHKNSNAMMTLQTQYNYVEEYYLSCAAVLLNNSAGPISY